MRHWSLPSCGCDRLGEVAATLVTLVAILVLVGCSAPAAQPEPEAEATAANSPPLVAAIHHAVPRVQPVLTWRDNPSPSVPLALTASDGTGLDLVEMKARVVIEDPLALTELRLSFDNPENRRREGRFEIELPPGAALSRLAMKIGDRWQEGEVVERGHGQRTYESFLHERPNVDPALMEHDTSGRVRVRVFPILPHEHKEIIVSYSQPLGQAPYVLPLAGLSKIEHFDARVIVHTHDPDAEQSSLSGRQSARRVVELQRENFSPQEDLVVELGGAAAAAGVHAGPFTVVRIAPDFAHRQSPLESLVVMVDTSASARVGFEQRLERLGDTLHQIAEQQDFALRVVAFDQTARVAFEGPASTLHMDVVADLIEARALGASNLEAAIDRVVQDGGQFERALLVYDGTPTAGALDRAELRPAIRRLESLGVRRLDALAPIARADRARLSDLTTALPEPGAIFDDTKPAESLASALSKAPFGDVTVQVDGAAWSWPNTLRGVAPGQDVLVFAHYQGLRPPAVRVEFSDPMLPPQIVHTLPADRPLVERAWARARIERIEDRIAHSNTELDAGRERLRQRIIELSTHYRVLTEHTALLVLESEADYRRFRIARRGLADILTVDEGSIRVHKRSEATDEPPDVFEDLVAAAAPERGEVAIGSPAPPDAARQAGTRGVLGVMAEQSGHFLASPYGSAFAVGNDDEDVWGGAAGAGGLGLVGTGRGGGATGEGIIGLGNTGLIGKGSGGGGTGEGTIGLGTTGLIGRGSGSGSGYGASRGSFGTRGRPVPRVRLGKPNAIGALEQTIVRRIARAHLNELRYCYHQALARRPALSGQVELVFAISDLGSTGTVAVGGTTLDEPMEQCMTRAIRRWRFPRKEGATRVKVAVTLSPGPVAAVGPSGSWAPRPRRRRVRRPRVAARPAHVGRYAPIHQALAAGDTDHARRLAWDWVHAQPGDTMALLALGEALERGGRPQLAARVYGSLIDLQPSRADTRRAAGERLESLDDDDALALAKDTYARAAELRPDQPSGARLYAWALMRSGDPEAAFEVLAHAYERRYPAGRFAGIHALLYQDLALVAAAWLHEAEGEDHSHALDRIAAVGITPDAAPSVRLVATWETDTTDVDILPRRSGARSGGRLLGQRLADVRTGFGPEARIMRGDAIAPQLHASVRYFDRGAMGHAMGTLQVVSHDGQGRVTIESRPFVLMQQRGVIDLGTFAPEVTPPAEAVL